MADVVVERANLNHVEQRINQIDEKMRQQTALMNEVGNSVLQMSGELNELKRDFQRMMDEQKRTAAIQQATTELVRIRQGLDQEFGNYRIVRETMLGVLQATDSALVREKTISRVSEELMLSTPKYWLAPVLVAVSAWISNDRDLAERAIKEAMRRDEEQTALTMALICRRNRRVDTCYEWLSIYFSKQKAYSFTASNFRIVDAYVNNVFGPDKKHLCDEYLERWVNEIKGNSSNFEQEQVKIWRDFCNRYTVNIDADYPDMAQSVNEYGNIKGYISRIESTDAIEEDFQKINNAYVDDERLREDIDHNLIELVSRYDKDEEQLRNEERLQQEIKDNGGSKEAAIKKIAAQDTALYEKSVDLIEQMTRVIAGDSDCRPSEKKTAMSFLGGYVRKGFDTYIRENKENFPSEITMNIDGWSGRVGCDESRIEDKYHKEELVNEYTQTMERKREQELAEVSKDESQKFKIGAGICGVLGVAGMFIAMPVGIVLLVVAIICLIRVPQAQNKTQQRIQNANQAYSQKIVEGQNKIRRIVYQWDKARTKVIAFDSEPVPELRI